MTSNRWRRWFPAQTTNRRQAAYRPRLETLESRCLPSANLVQNFTGLNVIDGGGPTPPDTILAVSRSNVVVEAVNDAIEITDKSGNMLAASQQFPSLFSPIFTSGDSFSDPYVVYDDLANRFYLCILEIDSTGKVADLDFAASNSDTPSSLTTGSGPGQWTVFSKITAVREGSSTQLPDYPKMGWNADGVFITFNQFDNSGTTSSFLHVQLLTISRASIASDIGETLPTLTLGADMFQTDLPGIFTLIPARMHGSSAGGPEFFVTDGQPDPTTGASTIDVVEETGFLSASPVFTTTPIDVAAFGEAVSVPELAAPAGAIDNRMLSADWNNNQLVAAHTVTVPGDTVNHVHWYEFDTSAAAGGGSPTLTQQGDISAAGVNVTYPSIAINNDGDIGLCFLESASTGGTITQAPSMFVAERLRDDPAGTVETPVEVQAGVLGAPTGGLRGGDYSATVFDPADGTSFWSANEFTRGSDSTDDWGTQIASFNIGGSTPPQASPPAVTSLSQTRVFEGTAGLRLVVTGTGFDSTSTVQLTGTIGSLAGVQTTVFSDTVLAATIPAADLILPGSFTLTVTNSSTGLTSAGVSFAAVPSHPAGIRVAVAARVNASFTAVIARFNDPDLADTAGVFTATIDWGDGTTPSAGSVNPVLVLGRAVPGLFAITGGHTYTESGIGIPVTVTLVNGSTPVLTVLSSANVTGTAAGPSEVREGSPTVTLLVTGTGFDTTTQVQVGGAGVPTTFVSSTLLKATVAAFLLTEEVSAVAVTLNGDGTLTAPTSFAVVESVPTATFSALTLSEGVPFSGTVASFTDPNFPSDRGNFRATIDWGDGTVQGATLVPGLVAGQFLVHGSRTYQTPGAGIPVTVTIADDGAAVQTVTARATVLDRPLLATGRAITGPLSGRQFTQIVASFTDRDTLARADEYLATIRWGDGSSSAGTVVPSGTGFVVVGTHAFGNTTPTTFPDAVVIQDAGGLKVTALGTIRVGGGDVSVGSDAGSPPLVTVFDADRKTTWITIQPYEASFRGGVRVASGTLFGQPVVVTAPGPGRSPLIEIWNRSTGRLLASFLPMPSPGQDVARGFTVSSFASFTGGMYVALGDLNGDGVPDLVVAEGAGGTDTVEVFDGRFLSSTLALVGKPFQALGGRYTAGVRVAAGGGDLVVANGPGAPPVVGIYQLNGTQFVEQKSFNPYASTSRSGFTGGSYVAMGDVNGDGKADVIVAMGAGRGPLVQVFDGANLFLGTSTPPQLLTGFTAANGSSGGVRVAAITLAGASEATIWTVPGPGSTQSVAIEYAFVARGKPPAVVEDLLLGSAFDVGAFVG